MALGKQFENTYWEDPETGETHTWTREKDPVGELRHTPTHRKGEAADEFLDSNVSGISHQGLLLHPATATGTKDDPLVPLERREASARRAAGLNDLDAYKKKVKSKTGVKISDHMARSDADLITNSIVNSEMPIREMDTVNTQIYLNPRHQGGHAEVYSSTIMVGKRKEWKEFVEPEHTIKVTSPSDTPIHNPKFWDWWDKHIEYESADETFTEDQKNREGVKWGNPATGETITSEEAFNRTQVEDPQSTVMGPRHPQIRKRESDGSISPYAAEEYDFEKHGPLSQIDPEQVEHRGGWIGMTTDIRPLREAGFVPNLFPGKGKASARAHVGETFTIDKDYPSGYNDEPTQARVHTRFVPGDVREEVVPEKRTMKKVPFIEQGTVVHEIGHQQDTTMDDPFSHRYRYKKDRSRHGGESMTYSTADPMEEGFADGYTDRYGSSTGSRSSRGMGNMYEDVLHNPSDPANAMRRGYGVDDSRWKNDTHRALYVASRIAARTGRDGREQYPSRNQVMQDLGHRSRGQIDAGSLGGRDFAEHANRMALGHMLTRTPSLMNHLETQGLGKVGREARNAFIGAYRQKKQEEWENSPDYSVQDRLPGFG